ncbi:GntR family transcriptional regulator [Saccharopolyspora sp. K220]|uniref:GntR family transcriptional regulator n=1 Tax=Saccharopolyspora soli TaxID=2926618 RepID=UPI001F583A89|nr:GntR family transcriptional regulator [Saccharopolyspora soli]MCI2416344.1 GntR family transcriptional regulator [Saccharopolyspora soli]
MTTGQLGDLASRVYSRIREQILDRSLEPGQTITISALAESLGCSHTPVREALATLAAGELVTKIHNRGYRVSELPGHREVADLYDFRFLVEPWAAARAAVRVSPTQLRQLNRELDRFAECLAEGDAPARALADHDEAFHRLIFTIADNDHAAKAYERCQVHLNLFRLQRPGTDNLETLAEHRAIVAALRAGDPNACREAMHEHITNSHERMLPPED